MSDESAPFSIGKRPSSVSVSCATSPTSSAAGEQSSTSAIRTTCVWDHLLYTMALEPDSMLRKILSSTPVVKVSMMGGHVHYPSEYEVRGEEHTVQSVISGCLCSIRITWKASG